MKNKERLIELILGIIVDVVFLILVVLYIFFRGIIFLFLSLILLVLVPFSIKMMIRPRERVLSMSEVRKKILKYKRRKFLRLIAGI